MIVALSLLPLSAAILSIGLVLLAVFSPPRRTPAATYFILLNSGLALWAFAYAIDLNLAPAREVTLAAYGTSRWWLLVAIVVGSSAGFTYWFLFGAAVRERGLWVRPAGIALAHVPALYAIAVVLTNSRFHLFSRVVNGRVAYAPLAIPYEAMTFLLSLAGSWMVTTSVLRRFGRRSAGLVGGASGVLILASLAWWTRSFTGLPLPINPIPAIWPAMSAVLGYQVLRYGLADIVPTASLRGIMENTDAGLAYLDRTFRFVAVNAAFTKQVGRTEAELIGRSYFELVSEHSRRELFERVVDTGESLSFRADPFALGDRQRRESYWDWRLSPVRAGEHVNGLVLSFTDVSEAVREQELSRTLYDIQSRVNEALDAYSPLQEAAAMAATAVWADSASIVVQRRGSWQLMQHCERPTAEWEDFEPEDNPLLAMALSDQRPLAVRDAQHDSRVDSYVMELLGIKGALVAPLVAGERLIGALSVEYREVPGMFGVAERDFLVTVADAIAVAIQNARLYHAERRIAERLQESMLTVPDRVDGLEFAHFYRSATETAKVGGDFYDVFETEPGRVGVLIGDVAGKGIEAAVVTSLVKNTIRAEAYENRCPGDVLTHANDILRRQLEAEVFVTAFFGLLDTATGQLSYASAGHPAPLLRRARGGLLALDVVDGILASFVGVAYSPTDVTLSSGDTLLLFTDGVIEARRDSDLFGEERLASVVRAADADPRALVRTVYERVLAYTGDRLADDIALLALRFEGVAAREPAVAGEPAITAKRIV